MLASLPGETPAAVRKQIVEASLTAFGVSIDKIIEGGVAEIQALEGYIRTGAADTQTLLAESAARIKKFEDEILRIRTVMDQRVQEQQAVTKACNERKLGIQQILEFFGQEAVARVVQAALDTPGRGRGPGRICFSQGEVTSMAGGGFFARLGNLWRGFLSLWISDVEKQHPEIAYENAINSMIAKYTRLKTATAAIIRRREDIDTRNQKARSDLAEVQGQLAAALDTNQDDLAVVLIQKQNALEKELAELRAELDLAQKDADSAKSSLITVQSEIRKLKSERDSMLAKMQSAQARIKIQEQLDGLSVDAEVKALDNVREHIKTTIAEANLGRELSESSLDSRLDALRNQAGDVVARQQLAEMKAKRAAQQASQGQKTL